MTQDTSSYVTAESRPIPVAPVVEPAKLEVEAETKNHLSEGDPDAEDTPSEATEGNDESTKSDPADETPEGEQGEAEETEPKETRFEKRARKLTSEKVVAQAAADAAKAEADYWKQRALGQEGDRTAKPAQPETTTQPAGKPTYEQYNDLEKYTEASIAWGVEQALNAVEAKKQGARTASAYETRVAEFAENVEDFHDVLDEFKDVPICPEIVEVVTSSDVGPQMAYHLAKNVSEAERINKLPPAQRYMALGRLEAQMAGLVETPKKATSDKKVFSKAPAPVDAVSKRASGKVLDINDPNISYADYDRLRKEQLKKKNK